VTLFAAVLVASLLGSIHCAAMCGGFVCAYAGAASPRGLAGLSAHAAYHAGRLVSYVALGTAAGAIGARMNDLGRLAGVGRGAAIVAGVLMVLWAATTIAVSLGARVRATFAPQWVRRTFGALLVAMRDEPPAARAAATGLLTTLIPCGWLYTFVVTAGGTGDAISGAVTMFAFWIGTVPILFALGVGARRLFGPFAQRLPVAGAVLVLVLGLLSIAGRVHPLAMHAPMPMSVPAATPVHASAP